MSEDGDCQTPEVSDAGAKGYIADRQRKTVGARVFVNLVCECGNDVTITTIQRTVICQGCGSEWRLE